MSAKGKGQSRLMTWGGILLSVVCLYIAVRGAPLADIGDALSNAHWWLVAPMLVGQVVFYGVKAWRWQMLLHPIRPSPIRPLVGPMMVGFMGNNLLPAHLGEFIRMHLGARLLGVSNSQVLATIVLERMFDFVAVLMFFGVSILMLEEVSPELMTAGYISTAVSVVGMAGAFVYVVWTEKLLAFVRAFTSFLPERLRSGVLRQLELGASGMAALRQPRLLFGIVFTSLLQWGAMAGCVYASLLAVDVAAPMPASFVVLAATVIGVMIPAAPGYFGTLHAAFTMALVPFSVEASRAFAAAVFYHTFPYIGVTLIGLYFLRQTGVRLGDLEQEAIEDAGSAA